MLAVRASYAAVTQLEQSYRHRNVIKTCPKVILLLPHERYSPSREVWGTSDYAAEDRPWLGYLGYEEKSHDEP